MGCLYWLIIGWWLEPIKGLSKLSNGIANLFIKCCVYLTLIMITVSAFVAIGSIVIAVLIPIILIAGVVKGLFFHKTEYRNVDFDNMTGQEFEYFCGELLKDNGFSDVRVTKVSGDHGVDVLAKKYGEKYAIQCKCYSENIGNKAVQEIYAGKDIYQSDVAVVMTNRFFTNQAREDAGKLGVELWDRNILKTMTQSNHTKMVNASAFDEKAAKFVKKDIKCNYDIDGMKVQFELNGKNQEVDVWITEANNLCGLYCVFFEIYDEFKKYKNEHPFMRDMNYKISAAYYDNIVLCENLYIYGKNLDGSFSKNIPAWLQQAKDILPNAQLEYKRKCVNEARQCFTDFVGICIRKNAIRFETHSPQKYLNDDEIDTFARGCNAYIEHQEEMEEYSEYFNIVDKDTEK